MRPIALSLLLVLPLIAFPQPPEPPVVPVTRLTLTPAAAPTPALRYELLPNFRERVPGNAALSYYRAVLMAAERRHPDPKQGYEYDAKIDELAAKPLKDIPLEELRNYLQPARNLLREVENGSKRDRCDWELERRIDAEGIGVLLPEVQKMRELARPLSLRCRLHMAEGKAEDALLDVRTGFAMARHTGDGPTLIQALVGVALFHIFAHRLEEVLELPTCPNLYWALTALPRPFHDMRRPVEGEVRMLEGTLPVLRDLEKGPMTPEQARAALEHWAIDFYKLSGADEPAAVKNRLAMAAVVAMQHPNARRSLQAMGKTAAELDAMPAAQVVLLDAALRFKSLRDEMFVWFHLPYREAHAGMEKVGARIERASREREESIFGAQLLMMLPAVEKVHFAAARTERRIAVLRTIEALRMHAAANQGRFPEKLADVTVVPVPADPVTGRPFEYELTEGGKALLTAPTPPGQEPNQSNTFKYELRLRK